MALSFGFSKTIKRKLITAPSAALADKKRKEDEDDKIEFIQSIGANGAAQKSKDSEKESNELVIPLIMTNRWHFPKEGDRKQRDRKLQQDTAVENEKADIVFNGATDKDLDLEQRAIREILREAQEDGGGKERELNIPLMMQNRIPDGFETDDNLDVSLRPPEPTLDDYDRIPVEEFGFAMLRGMGWKKSEGIGLRNKAVVEMKEPELRPRGLGLGATRPNTDTNGTSTDKNSSKGNNRKPDRPPSPPTMGLRLSSKSSSDRKK